MDQQQQELANYIYAQLQSGLNPDEITQQLRGAGWDEQLIAQGFGLVQGSITPPTHSQTDTTQSPTNAFQPSNHKRSKIKTAWLLMKQSFKVLGSNKQLIRYPLMGALVSLVISVVFFGVFYLGQDSMIYIATDVFGDEEIYLKGPGYLVAFLWYLTNFFITFVFSAGLTAHVLDIFRGRSGNFAHYMKLAWSKKIPILVLSLIFATVGLILRAIEQRARWLGLIVSRLLGAIWALATMFSLPIVVEGENNAPRAIKQSSHLFLSRWGENIAARISFAGLLLLFYLLIVIPFLGVMVVLLSPLGVAGIVAVLVLFLLSIILLSVVESAASSVLTTALYYYARYAQIPAAFDPELLNSVLIPKTPKTGLFSKK